MKELQEQTNEALTAERLEEIGAYAALLFAEGDDSAPVIDELLAEIERLREGRVEEPREHICENCINASGDTCYYNPNKKAQWVPLSELRPGAIFETQDAVRAVKKAFSIAYKHTDCILLATGDYVSFSDTEPLFVREIAI